MGTLEAKCQKCGEVFNPLPEEVAGSETGPPGRVWDEVGQRIVDISGTAPHIQRENGEECDGEGVVVGSWS